jgi:predicted GNAT family acetyltransferase
MKNKNKEDRKRRVYIRLTDAEFDKLNTQFLNSTSRKLSEFLRRIIFNKPVKIYNRNKSLDDLMIELILLRNELSAIGNNYNQEVKRLHLLGAVSQAKNWVQENEKTKDLLIIKMSQIKSKIDQINDIWLQ